MKTLVLFCFGAITMILSSARIRAQPEIFHRIVDFLYALICTYIFEVQVQVVEILSIISLDPSHLGCRIVVDTISEFLVASSNIDELSSIRSFFLEVQVLELHLIICNSLRDSIPLS